VTATATPVAPASATEPFVEELAPALTPERAFRRLAALPHCLFLDSALEHPTLGRYSFVAADPFACLVVPADGSDALGKLAARLGRMTSRMIEGLPPFQGGAAGLFGYELGRSLERLPHPRFDEFRLPAMAVGLYDVVLGFDHLEGRAWLVSQGLPETDPKRRRRRAIRRARRFRTLVEAPHEPPRETPAGVGPRPIDTGQGPMLREGLPGVAPAPLPAEVLAPQFPVDGFPGLSSNFSRDGYLAAVRRVVDYICAGDVFQVNLAQRLLYPAVGDSVSLYLRLRERNPAPFAGYFDLGAFQVVSASPERFLRVERGAVETRPIKGTRRRTGDQTEDRRLVRELRHSEKDRAENVMIVDLLRNDLSRVCRPESVCVSQLCGVESYPYVQHLVSAVRGELEEGRTPIDLLRASFPGGSITGAPKVRAMEIIAELEPTSRGAYCGSLGYVGFDGSMDLSIVIRTITAGRGWWQLPVGGGIVAQSDPELEYEETWHKARGLLRALR